MIRWFINLFIKTMPQENPQPPVAPQPIQAMTTAPVYFWETTAQARLSVRQLCDAMGMPLTPTFNVNGKMHLIKDVLCACIEVESNFNPKAVHYNKDQAGHVWSADWGIVQVNDYWNIGVGKQFPSVDYVTSNPEACVRWMIQEFLSGHESMWSSYSQGLYKQYLN